MGSSPIDRTIFLSRLWRNWQTRYFEGVVNESSYGFKSHQPHHLKVQAQELFLSFFRVRGTRWGVPAVSAAFPKQLIVSNDRFSIRS